ncbi:hypothetical protein [Paenimyroides baculatum]|uniref:Uncharacterized protein n=1 Tax=Paenimyroides baculatum TaxID=2608000 RepID=A0A5M6CFS1_9FLAO|nr:hypothetical protein [Paenimyroides baculatum]KAA5533971.1 hypothetical protein F0460_11600 [Paenimyroides baculatum]
MLQNLQARVSRKLPYALLLCALTTSQTFSQSKKPTKTVRDLLPNTINSAPSTPFIAETITISDDDIKMIIPSIENNPVSQTVGIYEVVEEMASFYSEPKEIENLEKAFNEFESKNRSKERFGEKTIVDEYNDKVKYANTLKATITDILQYIEKYNSSNERYKNKKYLLQEAQSLADKMKLEIVINEVKKQGYNTSMQPRQVKRELRLYYDEFRVTEKEINSYKTELLNMKIPEYSAPKEMYLKEQIEEAKKKTYQKSILKLTNKKVDYKSFVGTFDIIAEKYLVEAGNYEYLSGQLINDRVLGKTSHRKYQILKNQETNNLYLIDDSYFITKIKEIKEFETLKSAISKYGYSITNNRKVKGKMTSFDLTSSLIENLNKNPNYIKDIDSKYSQLAELVKELPAHTNKLDEFVRLYNLQRSRMSASNINSWKNATEKALSMREKIKTMEEKLDVSVLGFDSKDLEKYYEDFTDNLIISKHVLGL